MNDTLGKNDGGTRPRHPLPCQNILGVARRGKGMAEGNNVSAWHDGSTRASLRGHAAIEEPSKMTRTRKEPPVLESSSHLRRQELRGVDVRGGGAHEEKAGARAKTEDRSLARPHEATDAPPTDE
ncbi:hypothetical protein F503_06176 [Ophiostoma piceae UAMH 11346]|uniref:Uncharacterized protein n=1 Tax=Ophiostoma piceae (strain UAMH 11346) TaxID=1262450 RepID=S3BVQ6_OPHP1|nr:hypothetical protein F503_06176 [Ophiostoma piceae UAMH 11346]